MHGFCRTSKTSLTHWAVTGSTTTQNEQNWVAKLNGQGHDKHHHVIDNHCKDPRSGWCISVLVWGLPSMFFGNFRRTWRWWVGWVAWVAITNAFAEQVTHTTSTSSSVRKPKLLLHFTVYWMCLLLQSLGKQRPCNLCHFLTLSESSLT